MPQRHNPNWTDQSAPRIPQLTLVFPFLSSFPYFGSLEFRKEVGVDENDISDSGAETLAAALPQSTSLQHLYIGKNKITKSGEGALQSAAPSPMKVYFNRWQLSIGERISIKTSHPAVVQAGQTSMNFNSGALKRSTYCCQMFEGEKTQAASASASNCFRIAGKCLYMHVYK